MYTGIWSNNRNYGLGDIVLIYSKDYFICSKKHISNNLTFPSKEDIYWIQISTLFLNNLSRSNYNILPTIFEEDSQINVKRKRNQNDTYAKYKKHKINITEEEDEFIIQIEKNHTEENNHTDHTEENNENNEHNEKDNQYYIQYDDPYYIHYNEQFNQQNEQQNEQNEQCDEQLDEKREEQLDKQLQFKRKLESLENEIKENKRIKLYNNEVDNLRDEILLMNIDINTKTFILDKHDNIQKMHGSDFTKGMNWLKTVCNIPYGIYKPLDITKNDSSEIIKEYFKNIKLKLDESIHGLEEVKQEILEFVARKVTNPESKGHILALYGNAGVGKSKILKTLGKALNLPLYQINFGGLNDVSLLTGHSETYIGSKPGKIVEILQNSNCMNPIIYFDEIDKISENKAIEIYGILTHILDEEQNNHFQDNYLSNVNIDLSKVFFVLAFNDITKIDKIVCDRLKIIYIDPPKLEDKITICSEKMIPEILKTIKIKDNLNIIIDKEVIEYIIVSKTQNEQGVRQLRKNIEKIANRINYDILLQNSHHFKYESERDIIITRSYVDLVLLSPDTNKDYLQMYI
jgi:ATP-dependent Lon protease